MNFLIFTTVLQILFIFIEILNVKYRLMEAKRNEISTLLRADLRENEISKQLKFSRMTVNRVQRLKASVTIMDRC